MKYNRGTEITLTKFKSLNVLIGSIDKYNPKNLYIRINGWATPIDYDEVNDYQRMIRGIDKKIRVLLFNELNSNFNKNLTMVDLDMRESGILNNKPSFMSCEITLTQTHNYLMDSSEIYDELNRIIKILVDKVFDESKIFNFYRKKSIAKKLKI